MSAIDEDVLAAAVPDEEIRRIIANDDTIFSNALIQENGEAGEEQLADIRKLSVPLRMKLALFGNRAARGALIRDSNRMVQICVLGNPRLSEDEVGDIARSTQVDDSVIRKIANSPNWLKIYAVKFALVSNPKTPIDVSLKLLKLLQNKDIQRLSKSKNIPQVVATHAIKLMEKRR